MRRMRKRIVLATLLVLAGSTCLTAGGFKAPERAVQATQEIPEDRLLDVSIEIFDPGVPDPTEVSVKKMDSIYPDVRRSEARYVPIQLKETLQSTGYWGAVRVVPGGASSAEITVTGVLIKSTGKDLAAEIQVTDVSGKKWLEKKYKQEANPFVYLDEKQGHLDPFQGFYAAIANDMLERLKKLEPDELRELRSISELRFASQLAPADYAEYLELNRKGRYEVQRLPADDDPMMMRVAQIRERDYMFVDTLNEHYSEFCVSMEEPYDNWRSFSYEEQVALAELRRQARIRKIVGALAILGAVAATPGSGLESAARDAALIGGIAAIQSGMAKGKEAKIHAEALRELANSFGMDVAPMVVEIEGETVRLTGTREEQYTAWRELLGQIYAAETGLPQDPNTVSELTVEGSTGQ